ncbi:MAG: nucleotidyltransferase domain-containing protein [Candidatus Omnitrophica bacterium]|nr:nucleotidyltransferase domain-containing protein [Candidatus Omnitrophota bacterium]
MKKIFKKIVDELSKLKDIKAVILYGSFARGENTPRSDIDLFIITDDENAKGVIEEKIISLETSVKRNIQPTIRIEKELKKTDTGLLQNIFQEGLILYMREPVTLSAILLLKQKPYVIYTFQLNNLSQRDKARFNRQLYEQKIGKYQYRGLLNKIGGKKLSDGCIMLPYSEKIKIEKLFKKFKITFNSLNIWK